ncbi:MAG: hypothetical protein U1E63_00750 [Burkholderiales bacterium]
MAAGCDKVENRWKPALPQAAKEVIFWCAVVVAVVSGGVLIGQMDAVWRFPEPAEAATRLPVVPTPGTRVLGSTDAVR